MFWVSHWITTAFDAVGGLVAADKMKEFSELWVADNNRQIVLAHSSSAGVSAFEMTYTVSSGTLNSTYSHIGWGEI